MEIKDITNELEQYQLFLEQPATDDANEMAQRLASLNTILARTGLLLADAKRLRDDKMKGVFQSEFAKLKQLSPTLAKQYADASCSEENFAVNWAERVNRSCVHVGDNLRTIISLAKENMRLTNCGYNTI